MLIVALSNALTTIAMGAPRLGSFVNDDDDY